HCDVRRRRLHHGEPDRHCLHWTVGAPWRLRATDHALQRAAYPRRRLRIGTAGQRGQCRADHGCLDCRRARLASASMDELREEAETVLRRLAGDQARLRDDQWSAIEALVVRAGRVLCVQRTGWGKSAVYFIATALLRARGSGPTVIVSPLLALMRNQVEAAGRAGIQARTINSANLEEWDEIASEVVAGAVDV